MDVNGKSEKVVCESAVPSSSMSRRLIVAVFAVGFENVSPVKNEEFGRFTRNTKFVSGCPAAGKIASPPCTTLVIPAVTIIGTELSSVIDPRTTGEVKLKIFCTFCRIRMSGDCTFLP
jgi:hypothetical protein